MEKGFVMLPSQISQNEDGVSAALTEKSFLPRQRAAVANSAGMTALDAQDRAVLLAKEVSAFMPALDTPEGKIFLGAFIAELLAVTEENKRESRRRKQAEGIAAAKAKGVQFGRAPIPIPENFHEVCRAWANGELSQRKAAKACGMSPRTFRLAAEREGAIKKPPEEGSQDKSIRESA